MIVCHCKALSDRVIRKAVRDGARSPRAVAQACQAGRNCGGCMPAVRDIVHDETRADDSLPAVAAS